jgi:hypothetical protein
LGGEREWAEWVVREGLGAGGKMNHALYVHMNNKRKRKKKRKLSIQARYKINIQINSFLISSKNSLENSVKPRYIVSIYGNITMKPPCTTNMC